MTQIQTHLNAAESGYNAARISEFNYKTIQWPLNASSAADVRVLMGALTSGQ